MRLTRRRRKQTFIRRRRRKNYIPLITFLVALGFVLWLGVRFFSLLFSDVRSESTAAEIQILKGRAEFTLIESDAWTPVYSEQKFLEGDSLRTAPASRISLEFLGGNMIFLDENSELFLQRLEEKSSGKKYVTLVLRSGRMWARVLDDSFKMGSDSSFVVETSRLRVHVRGTIFDLSTNAVQDSLQLIKGNVDADILEIEQKKNIQVGVGQKLVVSPASLEQMREGADVLGIIDAEFIESEWHLGNLERFFPQEAAQIRRRIELTAPSSRPIESSEPVSSDLEPPRILTPADGTRIPASQDALRIEGTAPLEAAQIVVNGYTLTRFQPGDRKWVYFAATKFGTLVGGENKFSIVAVKRDGSRSVPTEITVFYEGETQETVPSMGNSEEPSGDVFQAPVITRPAVIVSGEPYQTSSEVVTILGIVDPRTNAVDVNGFRLQKFQPGQTEFSYIANANYNNMKQGENVYEITAFGPDGKKATTSITIVYTPINVGE
ncbi:FecR family protein [Candidatus Gracilibacteria bacterium]|nr:FecR family protein [Candidatus Gracilibacteria bacterium]